MFSLSSYLKIGTIQAAVRLINTIISKTLRGIEGIQVRHITQTCHEFPLLPLTQAREFFPIARRRIICPECSQNRSNYEKTSKSMQNTEKKRLIWLRGFCRHVQNVTEIFHSLNRYLYTPLQKLGFNSGINRISGTFGEMLNFNLWSNIRWVGG